MAKSFRRNRKAVSPVIATIIIVAVAIVMSIAVAYWMLGLAGTFTRYEKLEFVSAYATAGSDHFNITLRIKNTGSATATIDLVLINGIPHNDIDALSGLYFNSSSSSLGTAGSINYADRSSISYPLNPGEEVYGLIQLEKNGAIGEGNVTSGMTIEVMIQTAAGNQYPKSVTLP